MPAKPHMNIVIVGHVDHGKSTIFGRLLYDTGAIRREEIEELKKTALEYKIEGGEFAFIVDQLKEERARGMTIDISHRPFETQKYYFTIIDAPGHRDFVKNMITGASQADGAILVVSARPGEGVQEQTKEHVFLVKVLGINQLVVAISKMDLANYSEAVFNKLKQETIDLLKPLGFSIDKIIFVPTAAQHGENIVKRSDKMPWYKGPTLVEALDTFEIPKRPFDKPLRIPIQDVYSITGVGTVPVGKVESGVLKVNDIVVFEPPGLKGEVKSIEMHHQTIPQANPGDNIGFNVKGVAKQDIKRGDVAGHPTNPPTVAKEFIAQIVVLNHPTVIAKGYTPVIHCHTATVSCRIEEIIAKIDSKTGQVIQEHPEFIKNGDVAKVKFIPSRPMVIERQSEFPGLARFAIRDMGQTVAAGICIDIVKAK
ncbi:MAG: translation elongation factor EF-1 subunit alpha [Candidatus Aenigmarchaeota archaeon]|nr:translation elongation factor EF-1 subunit alpha [Candidatus Aenigmarchaeota archaeon]MDW8149610.1 translation elongation factor EF-1 subunit alpha [Candidatus Aenigmarchaeota archaeon]